jgi:hypothetical protein
MATAANRVRDGSMLHEGRSFLKFPATALFNGLHVPQDMTESVRLAAEAVQQGVRYWTDFSANENTPLSIQ